MSRLARHTGVWLAGTVLGLCVLLGLVGAGLWVWSGTAGSLATAAQLVRHGLPGLLASGQSLELEGAQGVLREGGSLALVRWRDGEKTIEAHDVVLAWDWRALEHGQLHLPRLQVRWLRLVLPGESGAVPAELQLPLHLDVQFVVDTLEVVRPVALTITQLKGSYRYDGEAHQWDVTQAHMAAGRYTTQGRLQAAAPMAVAAQLAGTVSMPVRGSSRSVVLQAQASVQGALSGRDASLHVSGDLRGAALAAPARSQAHAQLEAQVHPWQAQPVLRAHARWSALDLAALWPQAPQTLLTGDVSVAPDGAGWKAQTQLQNAMPGPANQNRLPLQSAQAQVLYRDGQWTVQRLQAQVAGGTVSAQGQFSGAPATGALPVDAHPMWTLSATLSAINPALLDTRLAPVALAGTAQARQSRLGVAFAFQMQAAARTSRKLGTPPDTASQLLMRLQHLQATGLWTAPMLQLDRLEVQAHDAALQGQVRIDTRTREMAGKISATAPGLVAVLDGALGRMQGQGSASLQVADAGAATRWLARWPLWAAPQAQQLAQLGVQGAGTVSARWQGGWQNPAHPLRLDAQVQSDRLDFARADSAASPVRLRAVQATLSGSVQALVLTLQAQADVADQAFALQARLHGGQLGPGRWDAWLDSAQLTARSTQREGEWSLRLARAVALQWRQSASTHALDIAAGALQWVGPVPGTAQIAWEPAAWSQKTAAPAGSVRTVWHTRGSLQGLPLAWLEILGQTRISNLGLRGDLVFGGQWDATGGEALAVRAVLERTGGDLQLLSDDTRNDTGDGKPQDALRAGLRQARMDLQVDQTNVAAKLLWNSDNAGSASAQFSTRLRADAGGWAWEPTARVAAQVRASLPRVGVWSLLAPPGWRMQGTLEADTTLSGTRAEPQWSGTLQARDLSVRSVVDGIDFSQGSLRARLQGQRLEIEDFRLQGAGGASGGQLQASGSVVWLAPGQVRMQLDAVAQALRVGARADQRLVVSGRLSGRLEDARLTVRGALVADQALWVLPEDTTPRLGSDVVVRPSAQAQIAAAAKAGVRARTPATATSGQRTPLALDVEVRLDPGNNFQVTGAGLRTRLSGQLTLSTDRAADRTVAPRLRGELRTVSGTYKAYGQALDITQGVLRFSGPYDNPTLDILALRPNLQQKVGVQVSGTAQIPVVRLYADPDLPDAEKLSWLMLGRAPSASGGGADSALFQQAALALLSGSGANPAADLVGAFGLDEVSVGEANTTNADGTTGASATTVKLGKRLSRDFYVAYERSIASTLGTFYVFYDLSRRFTLRAQSGADSAVDLIYTTRFD